MEFVNNKSNRLRKQIELALAERQSGAEVSQKSMDALLEEIHIYHQELEFQNDELNRIRHDLEISKQQYAEMFEFAPIAYVVYDELFQISHVNREMIRMLGFNKDEVSGKKLTRSFHPASQDVFYFHIKRLNKTRHPQSCELLLLSADGNTINVKLHSNVWQETCGCFFRSAIIDVTREKLADELQREVIITRKAVEFKQNFLANMSHEIRTPLTGIEGMTQILSETPLSEVQKEYLDIILASSRSLKEIINQILDYSKIEAGRMLLKNRVFKTSELVNKTEQLFASLCGVHIPYEIVVSSLVPENMVGDEQRIFQVISNFVSNAVKYAPQGLIAFVMDVSKVYSDDEQEIRIEVKDKGMGILPDKQQYLFSPFSQLEVADNRLVEGTGLGLSISKELSQLMGGDVGLESKPGKGSSFWFTFRVRVPSKVSENEIPEDVFAEPVKPLRILLVEDKKVNQKVISLLLQSEGHVVHIANNGREALDIYEPGAFDLILMDVQMPVMDGVTATKELKSSYENLPPIVGLSANAFEGDREKYMAKGMDEYLTKPVRKEDIFMVARKLGLG